MTYSELKEGPYTVRRWGGGVAIAVIDARGREIFLQGEDALEFEAELDLAGDLDEGGREDFLAEAMADRYSPHDAWNERPLRTDENGRAYL